MKHLTTTILLTLLMSMGAWADGSYSPSQEESQEAELIDSYMVQGEYEKAQKMFKKTDRQQKPLLKYIQAYLILSGYPFGDLNKAYELTVESASLGYFHAIQLLPQLVLREPSLLDPAYRYVVELEAAEGYPNLLGYQEHIAFIRTLKKDIEGIKNSFKPKSNSSLSYMNEPHVLFALFYSNLTDEAYDMATSSNFMFSTDAKELILCRYLIHGIEVKPNIPEGIQFCKNIVKRIESYYEKNNINLDPVKMFTYFPISYSIYREALYELGAHYSGVWDNQQYETDLDLSLDYLKKSTAVNSYARDHYHLYRVEASLGNEKASINHLIRAADAGFNVAQYRLGILHLNQKSSLFDVPQAISLLNRSNDNGIPNAATILSKIYSEGKYVKRDKEEAKRYLLDAAARKDPEATLLLGMNYYDGTNGFRKNQSKGVQLLRESIDLGSEAALRVFSTLAFNDPLIINPNNIEIEVAENTLLKNARNLEETYTLLASRFHTGFPNSIPRNSKKSCEYFKKLKNQQNHYGIFMYSLCDDVEINEAISLLLASEKNGIPQASYHLGYIFAQGGTGIKRDLKKARHHFSEALKVRQLGENQNFYLKFYNKDILQVDQSLVRRDLNRVDSLINEVNQQKKNEKARIQRRQNFKSFARGFGKGFGETLEIGFYAAMIPLAVAVEVLASPEGQQALMQYNTVKREQAQEQAAYKKGRRDGQRYQARKKRNLCNVDSTYC
ncbi:sel1 repeat family protein [Gammaproteobacteria bacterium]|nr:sel1 repeat family protein [Gammaproteobacteria bacterium]